MFFSSKTNFHCSINHFLEACVNNNLEAKALVCGFSDGTLLKATTR